MKKARGQAKARRKTGGASRVRKGRAGVIGRRSAARRDDKGTLQFAPNFSVYVLPPGVVCLYSEDRKFFLHGPVYCALAEAIGEGGSSFDKLVRELGRQFPADKVREGLNRLIERRYVVPTSPASASAAAAYWMSLGVPLETAEENLQKCRVRIRAIDVAGEAELAAALAALGVRVVNRAADLTVVLANDYLEARLADLNLQNLADRTPWVLVQPSGIFPLVGPVFTPGKSACWVCLADRMKRNREIKALLDRGEGRRVVASPLVDSTLGGSGIALAAVEVAKAIATDFRTDLSDHLVSLDLLGATMVKHYVPLRPQCPACGRKELRDPRRKAVPVELGPGEKLVMTSGGYRTVASRATVARFKKHVSPLTGVVSRLERIDADIPMNTNYYAAHNFSAPAESVGQLRAGLSGGSFGKGSTAEQGEASALMEAIERYSGIFQGDEIRVTRRLDDFAADEAIHPNTVLLYSEAQYRRAVAPTPGLEDMHAPVLFDRGAKIEWSPAWSLRDGRFRYLPTSILYFFYRGFGAYEAHADSNGCAAGNTLEEAIVQGFLELVERDAYAIWWYNRVQRPQVDLNRFDDAYVRDLQTQLAETGRRLWVLDVTSDLGIPTFIAIAHWMDEGRENIEFGSGAHFDARIALLRALTEVNQFLSIGVMGGGKSDKSSLDGTTPLRIAEHPFLTPGEGPAVESDFGAAFGLLNTREQATACVNIAERAGLDFLVLDQTRPDIGVPVVRVIVPGMRHFYRRFAPGRLYDVPVKLGWRDRPLSESDLNPYHPHT